ncbi:SDR family oxidoreductase [Streptomyces silvensis]|uniref:LysR family transcriptional regulator n=1 Tax=Streptomyces silvensis TaxID=1765722 RepID=A0A0W7X8I7_9ACTN|nr:NAD(P)H-binding protein [Streptomyces silvensis]KUF18930.1 LysR family transcriptional regulator [Streptomyces silvensis]
MKITVIGATGLIGSQLVSRLGAAGHEVVPASLSTGVDLLTGAGLDEALAGADTVVNVTNSPTFDEASLDFFRTTSGHLLSAGERAGVRHQVALSIVGVDQVPQLDYYRAKTLQEDLLKQGATPYSIVRATQFFEFMDAVLSWTADAGTVRLPATRVQPVATAEVVEALADVATAPPLNGTLEVAGPDVLPLDELGRRTLAARKDDRTVVTDDKAGMFAAVEGDVLIAGPGARLAPTRYEDWLATPR